MPRTVKGDNFLSDIKIEIDYWLRQGVTHLEIVERLQELQQYTVKNSLNED